MVGKTFIAVAAGVAAVNADCTFPYANQLPGNSIFTPDGSNTPTIGVPFSVTYDGSGLGQNLRFLLLRGPGNNLVELGPIAEVQNCGTARCSFQWTPAANLEPDTSRYGLRLLDLSTCNYQYTTQFGLNAGAPRSSSSAAAPSASASAPAASSSVLPPRSSGSVAPPASSGSAAPRSSGAPVPSSVPVPSGAPVPSGRPTPPADDCEDEPAKPAPSGYSPPAGSAPPAKPAPSGYSPPAGSAPPAKPSSGAYSPPAGSSPGGSSPAGSSPPAGPYYPNNGTGSSNGTGGVSPTYRPLQSNDGARMAISAFGAIVAFSAAIMAL